jgi:hypothetical protein
LFRESFQHSSILEKEFSTISRITALWAFSEAALGGILHALRIPFTGLFIGGSAVIFLTLIAYSAERKSTLLKATFIVILIKAMVSPHTPLNAYIAVFLQGLFAYVIFSSVSNKKFAALLLGFVALTYSAFQRVFVLTILFGNTLWESIDAFGIYLMNEFLSNDTGNSALQLSYILIGAYGFVHISGGIFFGIVAGNIHKWIINNSGKVKEFNESIIQKDESILLQKDKTKKKRKWWSKKSNIAVASFAIFMMVISYTNPELDDNLLYNIIFMLIRSILIMYVWFVLLSPVIIRWVKKYLLKKQSDYSKEIESIIALFPYFKGIINYSWEQTKGLKNYKRIIPFLKNSFILLLMADIESYEKSNII